MRGVATYLSHRLARVNSTRCGDADAYEEMFDAVIVLLKRILNSAIETLIGKLLRCDDISLLMFSQVHACSGLGSPGAETA